MNCGRVCNQLSAYIDRELTGAEMMLMRHHLSDCDGCQAEYEALCRMKMLLGRLSTPEPRADLAALTLRRFAAQQAAAPFLWGASQGRPHSLWDRWRLWWLASPWQPVLCRWQMPLSVSAGALAAVLILTSVFVHRPRHSDALVATSPAPVLEGQDPVSHPITWEWASLEASAAQSRRQHRAAERLPLDWVTASYQGGPYLSFP